MKLFLGALFCVTLLFVTPSYGIIDELPLDTDGAVLFSVLTNCIDESDGNLEKAKECVGCFKKAFGSDEKFQPNEEVEQCFATYFVKGAQTCGEVSIKGLPQEEANKIAWEAVICLDRGIYHRSVERCAGRVGGNTMEQKVNNMIKCLSKQSVAFTVKGKALIGDKIKPKSEEYKELENKAQAAEMETHCSASSENVDECHACFENVIRDKATPDIQKFLTLSQCTTDFLGQNYKKCFENKNLIRNLGNKGNKNVKVILFHCYEATLDGYLLENCINSNPLLLTDNVQDSYYNVKECTRAERLRQFKANFPQDVQEFLKFPLKFEGMIFTKPQ